MDLKQSLNGQAIAQRILYLMNRDPQKTWSELGARLGSNPSTSRQAKIKRSRRFLRALEQEKILRELRATAEYLEISPEFLLLGTLPKFEAHTP